MCILSQKRNVYSIRRGYKGHSQYYKRTVNRMKIKVFLFIINFGKEISIINLKTESEFSFAHLQKSALFADIVEIYIKLDVILLLQKT